MARVILSEYAAKKLLIGDDYRGSSVVSEEELQVLVFAPGKYVVKVDDGTKKRNKKGLVVLSLDEKSVKKQTIAYLQAGHRRVLIEPMIKHDESKEQYISCTVVREGLSVLYSQTGGVDIEASKMPLVSGMLSRKDFLFSDKIEVEGIPPTVLKPIVLAMRKYYFSFLEINPYVELNGGEVVYLDAAVELDSSKLHLLPEWVTEHVQRSAQKTELEARVAELDERSRSSFSLTVFDPNASVFTLLSGGGASLVVLDTLVDCGLQAQVGNYGEYSGAPSREETKQYTNAILSLLFASKAPRKVLIVAGGVANFTDVTTTFQGIVDSCAEHLEEFHKQPVFVRVRRGGPRQAEGLALLEEFFTKHKIQAVVSDPSVPLSQVAADTKQFLDKRP